MNDFQKHPNLIAISNNRFKSRQAALSSNTLVFSIMTVQHVLGDVTYVATQQL